MANLADEFALKTSKPPKALSGVSILLVDDSRAVSEAVRMMAVRSGARIRRADCIASAQRHIMLFRPDVVIADLGLPDGNGVEVAKIVEDSLSRRPGILILSAVDESVAVEAVKECGADGYLMKPIEGLGAFQQAVLSVVPRATAGSPDWDAEFKAEMSGTDFYSQDLENALDMIEEAIREGDKDELAFAAQFLMGTASTAADPELSQCAEALSMRLASGHRGAEAAGQAISLINSRLGNDLSAAS